MVLSYVRGSRGIEQCFDVSGEYRLLVLMRSFIAFVKASQLIHQATLDLVLWDL